MTLKYSVLFRIPNLLYLSLRRFSVGLNESPTEKQEAHIFKEFLSKEDLLSTLQKNVVYKGDGLLVINKPAGVSKLKDFKVLPNPKLLSGQSEHLSMEEVLPELTKALGFEELHIAIMPERYASGVMILASTLESLSRIKRCITVSRQFHTFLDSYLVVTIDTPIEEENLKLYGMKLKPSMEQKVAVFVKDWSRNDIKKQRVKLVRIHHKVLFSSSLASLCQIRTDRKMFNSMRLYMATKCLCPIVGDVWFNARVTTVGGNLLLKNTSSESVHFPKHMPNEIVSALDLQESESLLIPLLLHGHSCKLPLFGKFEDGSAMDFEVSVPPPKHFIWACDKLGIEIPPSFMKEEVKKLPSIVKTQKNH